MKAIESSRKRTGIIASAQIYLFKKNFPPYATEVLKETKKQLHIPEKNLIREDHIMRLILICLIEPPAPPRDKRRRPRIYVKTNLIKRDSKD